MAVKKPNRTIKRGHYKGHDIGEMRTFKSESNIITGSYFVVLKGRSPLNSEKFSSPAEVKAWIDKNPK